MLLLLGGEELGRPRPGSGGWWRASWSSAGGSSGRRRCSRGGADPSRARSARSNFTMALRVVLVGVEDLRRLVLGLGDAGEGVRERPHAGRARPAGGAGAGCASAVPLASARTINTDDAPASPRTEETESRSPSTGLDPIRTSSVLGDHSVRHGYDAPHGKTSGRRRVRARRARADVGRSRPEQGQHRARPVRSDARGRCVLRRALAVRARRARPARPRALRAGSRSDAPRAPGRHRQRRLAAGVLAPRRVARDPGSAPRLGALADRALAGRRQSGGRRANARLAEASRNRRSPPRPPRPGCSASTAIRFSSASARTSTCRRRSRAASRERAPFAKRRTRPRAGASSSAFPSCGPRASASSFEAPRTRRCSPTAPASRRCSPASTSTWASRRTPRRRSRTAPSRSPTA